MILANDRKTWISTVPTVTPRLKLRHDPSVRTILDGAWWPRSRATVTELTNLITALDARHVPVTRIMLNPGAWDEQRIDLLLVSPDAAAIRRRRLRPWRPTAPPRSGPRPFWPTSRNRCSGSACRAPRTSENPKVAGSTATGPHAILIPARQADGGPGTASRSGKVSEPGRRGGQILTPGGGFTEKGANRG
jgi:hypothetical protein